MNYCFEKFSLIVLFIENIIVFSRIVDGDYKKIEKSLNII